MSALPRLGCLGILVLSLSLVGCTGQSGDGAKQPTVPTASSGSSLPTTESSPPETSIAVSSTSTLLPAVSTVTTEPPLASPAISRSLPTMIDSPADLPGYHVYRPSDLGAIGQPLPVVVWGNGGCTRYDSLWEPLLERWAAAGFIVIAVTEAPTDGPSELPDPLTAAAQAHAIDWAERQPLTAGSEYAGAMDLNRVMAAGNSCGGITTIALASSDPRVDAAFVLSGSGSLPGTPVEQASALMAKVSVPVAYVVGGLEDIARPNADADYIALPDGTPACIASRATGDHRTVSITKEILANEVSPIAINWSDLVFNGSAGAAQALTERPCPDCDASLWSVQFKHFERLTGGATTFRGWTSP